LCPVYVVLVDESEISVTERGSGGFGSTGVN
jgi:dUTPase